MSKLSKRKKIWQAELDKDKKHSFEEAINLAKKYSSKNFDETLDIVVKVGIDPKKGDQNVRGSCLLPHGTGNVERILVFAKGEKVKEATDAGADYVGGADLSEKIKKGWLEFEKVIATPDIMAEVGKIGKILGPRGLMPNPKLGTVTFDLKQAIDDIKKGKVEFRNDSKANIHTICGKINFSTKNLEENIKSIIATIIKLKPSTAKGTYIRDIHLSTTMGPGLKIDDSFVI